jgi:hypothetical protein
MGAAAEGVVRHEGRDYRTLVARQAGHWVVEVSGSGRRTTHCFRAEHGRGSAAGAAKAAVRERCRRQRPKGGKPSPAKARQMLRDRSARGRPLTAKQRRYFGAVASKRARRNAGAVRWTVGNTKLDVWEERDRLHIGLSAKPSGKTIADWWDDDARQMFEDGFFSARNLHASVVAYANDMRMGHKRRNSGKTKPRVGPLLQKASVSVAWSVPNQQWFVLYGRGTVSSRSILRKGSRADVQAWLDSQESATAKSMTAQEKFGRNPGSRIPYGTPVLVRGTSDKGIVVKQVKGLYIVKLTAGPSRGAILEYTGKELRRTNPSKKDYVATAAILRSAPASCRGPMADAFARHYAADSARFDAGRFKQAAGAQNPRGKTRRCKGCSYDVPCSNPGGRLARHLNPRTGRECNPCNSRRGDASRAAERVKDLRIARHLQARGLPAGTFGNPKDLRVVGRDRLPPAPGAMEALQARVTRFCKRCKGKGEVKLGPRMVSCPLCCRKGGRR